MQNENPSRRDFLRASGGVLGATWLMAHWPALAAAAGHAHDVAAGRTDHRFEVLTPAQARDVEAIAAQIVPSGTTPGAREAGVVYFIDRVHAGLYKSGASEFIAGLAAFQDTFARNHMGGGQFADLESPAQVAYLKSVEQTPFFGTMKFLTVAGLLSLPSYGGNAGKLGWKLVGFVDQHAWTPPFGYYDAGYEGFTPYRQGSRR